MAVNFGANTSRYYRVPDHADFTLPTSEWTWLLVVEAVDQTLANPNYVLSTGQINAANTINVYRGGNGTTAQCNLNGSNSATGSGGISTNGKCLLYASNIGGTVRVGTINLATLVHAIGGSFTQSAASNGGDIIIGGRADFDADRFWSGGVSWVALLNKGLTRDEIMAIVQGESLTDAHGSNIVELWDFATADAEIIGQYAGHVATRHGTGYGSDLADPLPYTTAGLVITDPPAPYASGPLRSLVAAMPEQTWAKVSTNSFSAAWAPAELRPLHGAGNPTPSKIIEAWSGFAWDSNRGDLIIYGGGHANYSGNDVYRWRASTLEWERCSLPSEIEFVADSSSTFQAIDGAQHAPASAHTYSNNTFLPRLDRFLTFGGAAYNSGSHFVARDGDPLATRRTGPYLFDPSKADPDKVGGTTGSHVQREGAYPEIVGGEMWDNRDWWANASTLQLVHVNGVTARADEFGKDVIYFGARLGATTDQHLFRMQINDINDPTQDKIGRVGIYWSGSPQSAGAYDPIRQVFVRTGGNSTTPLVYWSLAGSQVDNQSVSVSTASGSMADFRTWYLDYIVGNPDATLNKIGLDYDPVRGNFVMWFGGEAVWRFTPPTPLASTGWVAEQETTATSPALPQHKNTVGIYGKWRYIPGFDVFMGLEDNNDGEVWVYKPANWEPGPAEIDIRNVTQSQSIQSPLLAHRQDITTADVSQGQEIGPLSIDQLHDILIGDVGQAQFIESPQISLTGSLVIANILQGHSISAPAVAQLTGISIDDIDQGHFVGSITFTEDGQLIIDSVAQGQSVIGLSLQQAHQLAVANIWQDQDLAALRLEQLIELSINNIAQSQSIDAPSFFEVVLINIDDLTQAQSIGALSVSQASDIIIESISQGQIVQGVTFSIANGIVTMTITVRQPRIN